ncbi:uncharacterized protein MYCFIDRAFT_200009 [Pseudocercospora fijiensis CIRAD86]|uniref:Rhodopsin domain-containing protein n=1 Tax=Pseudocercospora fijiensis (strain CIRAD86) TaxID=383855 RepID=M3A2Y9_PSEFD|nr:uncharacterized protein MYCFIDRAFT_200009 [Pseudocercospora fijiensis CIRAD86]EME78921.1 hypothetical protein MYCFIDRAFT_200009 [Pseudocercospora fijiensis CIRAD86]
MSPPAQTIGENGANLANWICASLALTILCLRLATHWCKNRSFDKSAYVVIASMVILCSRTICNALILEFGSINSPSLGQEAMRSSRARTGSKLTLVARGLVTTYYWLQSALLLIFYHSILNHISWTHRAIRLGWCMIALTYIAVILATFLECRPIQQYWTPHSPQPQCLRAFAQILLQCIANAAIDVLLLIISLPILQAQARAFPRNLQLGVLYILGFVCIIVIGLRIHYVYRTGSVQQARSFWASIQVLVATFVANAPSIYGNVKNVKRRKSSVVSLSRSRSAQDDPWVLERIPSKKPPPKDWQKIVMPLETHKADVRRLEFGEAP